MKKCVFLDRDGVLSEEIGTYVYEPDKFIIPEGVPEALQMLKKAGYLLIVITNQAGIAKGLYTGEEVLACHQKLQAACGHLLDDLYYCPYHPEYDSQSLLRKPGSLMLEKAMAKFDIDPLYSWMVGDKHRDIEAGQKVQVNTILVAQDEQVHQANFVAGNLWEAANIILDNEKRQD